MCAPTSDTRFSSAGSRPRSIVPDSAPLMRSMASPCTYGASASISGFFAARAATSRQPGSPPSNAEMVACEAMPRMRARNSRSKPFITDSTTISAITPMAMPSIDTIEMNEMKWLRRFARV